MSYWDELCLAMNLLADDSRTIFLGQAVAYDGTTIAPSFRDVPMEKRLEMPVAEELQIGMSIGMSLQGYIPISIVPRWNFMLRAADQIINHLDRLSLYSDYRPKVIIRVATPSIGPFYPGPQHDDDFTEPFRAMLRTVDIVTLHNESDIVPEYLKALASDRSTIMVEYTSQYKDQRAA